MKNFTPTLLAGMLAVSGLHAAHASVFLNGNYLSVGVSASGGLTDDGDILGIKFDPTGKGSFTGPDFIQPGTPWEIGSVGYNGAYAYQSNNFARGNGINGVTTNTSTGSLFSTHTTGAYNSLSLTQDLSFGLNGSVLNFSVTLTNTSAISLSNVVYGRSIDGDQDVFASGSYNTLNSIVNGNLVTASGPVSQLTIGLFSDSTYAHTASVLGFDANPYDLVAGGNYGNGDNTIGMGWNIGTLTAGQSATITFSERIAPTQADAVNPPDAVPDNNASTLGLLGLAAASLLGFGRLVRSQQAVRA